MMRAHSIFGLVFSVQALAGCHSNSMPTAAAPDPERPYLIVSDQPLALSVGLQGRDLAGLYFYGIMACSNHDPAHIAETFEEMQELSEDPPGCERWHFVGAISDDPQVLGELGLSVDRGVFDDR